MPASRTPEWWKSAVVYQVYPASFSDSTGNGVGDLPGIGQRVDYLADLGVDAVWISPFYPSPGVDNGYDISDYCNVDPMFGTIRDFDELAARLHEREIKIIIDLVLNHTSDQHPWFIDSRASIDSPKRDWYWWRPPRTEAGELGPEPTNWESFFSGPTWTLDERTGEYYLHLFANAQPDLNWEHPDVRSAAHDVMNWWLDRGVDGFRLDVINLLSKPVGPDGALPDGEPTGTGFGDGISLTCNGPRMHEFLSEMHDKVLRDKDLLVVGEMPFVTVDQALRYTDPASGELDMIFTFEHMDLDTAPGAEKWDIVPLDLAELKATLHRWQQGLHGTGWNSLYWNNHDQPRIVSRWGDDRFHRADSAKTLATTLHLLQGTPFIYQGEELGMTNAGFTTINQYRDVESLNWANEARRRGVDEATILTALNAKSRDNARTPMQWNAYKHAGFTHGTPWLPSNGNSVEINAESAASDPDSVFHHYRALIALRHRLPVVIHGSTELMCPDHPQLHMYVRRLDDVELFVAANMSSEPCAIDIGAIAPALAAATTLAVGSVTATAVGALEMGPWASRVLVKATNT